MHPEALLGPGTAAARVLGHPAVLLGGARALLMQLAEARVAAGVLDHSSFEEDPYRRLARTFEVMNEIAFGSPERSARAARALAGVHRRVKGAAPDGRPYDAADPELAMWVHATLVDTVLEIERRYLGQLSQAARGQLYGEMCLLAGPLGIPDWAVPPTLGDFERYVSERLADLLGDPSNPVVAPWSLRIARSVVDPQPPARLGPLAPVVSRLGGALARWVTVDIGPPELCRAYGLPGRLDPPAARLLGTGAFASKAASPLMPPWLRRPSNLVAITSYLAS